LFSFEFVSSSSSIRFAHGEQGWRGSSVWGPPIRSTDGLFDPRNPLWGGIGKFHPSLHLHLHISAMRAEGPNRGLWQTSHMFFNLLLNTLFVFRTFFWLNEGFLIIKLFRVLEELDFYGFREKISQQESKNKYFTTLFRATLNFFRI